MHSQSYQRGTIEALIESKGGNLPPSFARSRKSIKSYLFGVSLNRTSNNKKGRY
jgi:hypothetical protein